MLTLLSDLEDSKGLPHCFGGDSISSDLCKSNRKEGANICILCKMNKLDTLKDVVEK